jgi:hypothetical protein
VKGGGAAAVSGMASSGPLQLTLQSV